MRKEKNTNKTHPLYNVIPLTRYAYKILLLIETTGKQDFQNFSHIHKKCIVYYKNVPCFWLLAQIVSETYTRLSVQYCYLFSNIGFRFPHVSFRGLREGSFVMPVFE